MTPQKYHLLTINSIQQEKKHGNIMENMPNKQLFTATSNLSKLS